MLTVMHVDTERGWRGGERQVLWLSAGMLNRGHRAIIVARPGDELARRAREYGINVIDLAARGELDIFAAKELRRIILQHRPQIVHAHTAHAAALAAMARIRTPARVVIARRVDFRLRRNLGTRFKYARADAVIAVSNAVAEVVARGGVRRERIHVVPDGVDLARRVSPVSPATLRTLGFPSDAPLVVQVAALVPHKDPLTFVRAIASVRPRLPEVRALLVGEGPLRQAVGAEVSRLGLNRSFVLTGFRKDADALLASAHVATLSSVEEGMGSVLLDAMAFGVPIAATSAGGIPEVVTNGETGLLSPPGDASALAQNIIRLLSDPQLGAALVTKARERVGQFSVNSMVDRTIAVYEQVL